MPNEAQEFYRLFTTDICGPFSVKSVDGYDSFITFIDDYSHYGYIYPIKERTEALDKFKILKIKIVSSDRGGVLRSAYPIWPSSWTFCKVLTGEWQSSPRYYTGRTSVE